MFSSYDHTLLDADAVSTKQKAVARELLEHVFEQESKEEYAQVREICDNLLQLFVALLLLLLLLLLLPFVGGGVACHLLVSLTVCLRLVFARVCAFSPCRKTSRKC